MISDGIELVEGQRSTTGLAGDSLAALGGLLAVVLLILDLPQDNGIHLAQIAVILWLVGLTFSVADRLSRGKHRSISS